MEGRRQVLQLFENLVHAKLEGRPSKEEDASTGVILLMYNLAYTELVTRPCGSLEGLKRLI